MPSWMSSGAQWNRTGSIGFALSCFGAHLESCRLACCRLRRVMPGVSPGWPTDVFRLTEYVIVGVCAAHDVRQRMALVAVLPIHRASGLLRNACVTVESLRHKCFQHIPKPRAVDCAALEIQRPRDVTEEIASRKALWLAFSVDHEVADTAGRGRSTRVRHGCAPSFFYKPEQRKRRGARRGHVQDSLALHKSCRTVFGSGSVPLHRPWMWPRSAAIGNFVSFIRSRVKAFPYHVGDFARFFGETNEFMVQAAIVCTVSDGVLQFVVERSARPCFSTTKFGKLRPKSLSGLRLWKTV